MDHAGPVYHGPSLDGRCELSEAWPLAAPVLKGASQGAEDGKAGSGEPVKGLTGGRPTARWLGDEGNGGGGRCASERLTRAKREAKEGARRGGAVRGCSRWLL
jgi:hypothetical protein